MVITILLLLFHFSRDVRSKRNRRIVPVQLIVWVPTRLSWYNDTRYTKPTVLYYYTRQLYLYLLLHYINIRQDIWILFRLNRLPAAISLNLLWWTTFAAAPRAHHQLTTAEALRSIHSIIIVCNHYDTCSCLSDNNDDNIIINITALNSYYLTGDLRVESHVTRDTILSSLIPIENDAILFYGFPVKPRNGKRKFR